MLVYEGIFNVVALSGRFCFKGADRERVGSPHGMPPVVLPLLSFILYIYESVCLEFYRGSNPRVFLRAFRKYFQGLLITLFFMSPP